MSNEPARNKVICPRCGDVKLETPPGTTILPTLGTARKAAGTAGECECGKRRFDADGNVVETDAVPTDT